MTIEQRTDPLVLGRRVRELRVERGLTLDDVGTSIGRAASHVSLIENGKREAKLSDLHRIAAALDVPLPDLLSGAPESTRARLEIALERAQRGPLFAKLGLTPLPLRKQLSDRAIETVLALVGEVERVHAERVATPEEARLANTRLRRAMRARNNHFADLEQVAEDLLRSVGHQSGPMSQRTAADLATHLGYSIHHVSDLPASARSVVDRDRRRVFLPIQADGGRDPRAALLQALAGVVLEHVPPADYAAFLQQRVRSNYLAGALLVSATQAVPLLTAAKTRRELSIEDLRDAFGVTYETAAHRFTNLATEHLGIRVHFLKVTESGAISKAYENDDVLLPADALGAVEGQPVCRNWSARRVFRVQDRFTPYFQYTDKPNGTYWCTSSIQSDSHGSFSISVGTDFDSTKWFRGRDTTVRHTSTCPDERCCRVPSSDATARWGHVLPAPRLDSSLFASMPVGVYPGVDEVDLYRFLDRHAT